MWSGQVRMAKNKQNTKRGQIQTKKPKHANNVKGQDLELDKFSDFGGEKGDLDLLGDVADDELEDIDVVDDVESEPIKRDELRDFIKNLGFYKVFEKDDSGKKDKLLKQPLPVDEKKKEDQTRISQSQKDSGKSKKKSKNKFKQESPDQDHTSVQDGEISSTTPSILDADYLSQYKPRKFLLVKVGSRWFDNQFSKDPVAYKPAPESLVHRLKEFAVRLYNDDVALYKKQQEGKNHSDITWMRTVLTSGTMSDKMAALILMVQEAPVHSLSGLDTLINIMKKKGRREALMAMSTLKELFLTDLLLDSKLRTFDQHPLLQLEQLASGNKDSRDRRLILWYYEAQLKERYGDFVKALEVLSHDNITAAKMQSLNTMFEVLTEKPEQEKNLLSMLVNKLGDPDYKLAAKAAHLLTRLVERHPNMKAVIVQDVERFMYRPNIAAKAQYYGVCFLNQLILSHDDCELAAQLITLYFSFFKAFIKKGEVDSKMLSALLTGVNRAFPYAKVDKVKIEEQMETLYKVVHIVNFNTSIQALMLLYQVMGTSDSISDRYYQALYRKLQDPGMSNSSKQAMFLNLVFKSLKKDLVDRRIKAFIKRLLQVCSQQSPSFICGTLILLSEVLKSKPELLSIRQVAQDSDDEEEEHFADAPEEEEEEEKKKLSETQKKIEGGGGVAMATAAAAHEGHTTASSWVHRRNTKFIENYDPHHRNPLYCRADQECIWELQRLTEHYHPSVALFARAVLNGELIQYPGDPLQDFTLIRFLDRFVYRNPKKKQGKADSTEGVSTQEKLQPRHKTAGAKGAKALAVNTEAYLKHGEANIPVDEKFFYQYFSRQAAKVKKNDADEMDSDADSISDNEFDSFLDKYEKGLVDSNLPEFGMDFAKEFTKQKTQKKPEKREEDDDDDEEEEEEDEEEEDDEDSLDEDGDLSDEEMDFSGDDDLKEAFVGLDDSDEDDKEDDDEEAIAFSDDDEDLEELDIAKTKKKNVKRKRGEGDDDDYDDEDEDVFAAGQSAKKKGKRSVGGGIFAAAEEFSHLIDDSAGANFDMTGSEAVSNKDNSSVKQLRWEMERDKWIHDQDWRSRKGGKPARERGRKKAGPNARGKPGQGGRSKAWAGNRKPVKGTMAGRPSRAGHNQRPKAGRDKMKQKSRKK